MGRTLLLVAIKASYINIYGTCFHNFERENNLIKNSQSIATLKCNLPKRILLLFLSAESSTFLGKLEADAVQSQFCSSD